MDESSWLASTDLIPMLIHLRGEVEPPEDNLDQRARIHSGHGTLVYGNANSVSQYRLGRFASHCCRKWWDLPLDEMSRDLLSSYERFLSGDYSWKQFITYCSDHWGNASVTNRLPITRIVTWSLTPFGIATLSDNLAWATACVEHKERIEELERTASDDDRCNWGFFGYDFPEFHATISNVLRPLPSLLREVVGNPFADSAVERAWLTPSLVQMAMSIDVEQAFDRLPQLADALKNAGCSSSAILNHCRQQGGHVRGCWVVDQILGWS